MYVLTKDSLLRNIKKINTTFVVNCSVSENHSRAKEGANETIALGCTKCYEFNGHYRN